MDKKIAVHLAEGFEEVEAVSIIDVLRRAGLETLVVSVTGQLEVTGSHGIRITADRLFEETDYASVGMIVLPGGMPGASHLKEHAGLGEQILHFDRESMPLAAICAAPLVFGHLGILKGHQATCYPGFENQLTGARVTGADVEISGHVITGKGAGVALQFALKIVEVLKGKSFARELAGKMLVH